MMGFNYYTMRYLLLMIIIFMVGCKNNDPSLLSTCSTEELLARFITTNGEEAFIYKDGKLYSSTNGTCNFELQYFDSNFMVSNYLTNSDGTFLLMGDDLFPTKNNYTEDFEDSSSFKDLFISNPSDTSLYWTNFTLQSPGAPEVSDYVALSQCILGGTCSFIDNKIELTTDPEDALNTVLKFTSVPPTADMVTSKSSISSTINFYTKNSEVWFEADYLIESGMPFSIVDFENSYFFGHPGPRVVIRNNKLEFENKFGNKLNLNNNSGISITKNQWFTLKVHLKYSNSKEGIIELWQDGKPIISTAGINLPTSNSIQNILEVGATASPEGCVLLFDNMRISQTEF